LASSVRGAAHRGATLADDEIVDFAGLDPLLDAYLIAGLFGEIAGKLFFIAIVKALALSTLISAAVPEVGRGEPRQAAAISVSARKQ